MSQSTIKDNIKDILPSVIMFLAASVLECAVIFPIMTGDYINYDSSYQYALTQHSLPEIFELLPYDYSPPFYAVALKLWTMVFGNTLTVMRAFTMVAVVGMFFIAAFPVRTLFGNWSAGVCLAITFCSTAILDLLHEIRPTIFAMFFFMAAAVYALIAYSQEKRYGYIFMTVFSVLCMYTHNIALVGMFCIYVVLLAVCLIRKEYKKLKYFLISGVISAVLYIPWLGVIINQISNVNEHFWTATSSWIDSIRWVCGDMFVSKTGFCQSVMNGALALGIIVVLLRHIKLKKLKDEKSLRNIVTLAADKSDYKNIMLLALFIAATFLMLEVVNLVVRNLTSQRYYAILGMVWIVLLSAVLGKLGSRICNIVLAASLMLVHYGNVDYLKKDAELAAETDIVSAVKEISGDRDIAFLHTHELSLGVMAYYFPEATHYVSDDIFTVLGTYDVFPVNVVDIGDYHDLWEYTDECFVFSNDWVQALTGDLVSNKQVISELADEDHIEEVGDFHMAYNLACKNFELVRLSAE